MASIGHLAAGAALGAVYSRMTGSNPRVTIPAFAGLAVAPDLDLLTALAGVPYNTPLAHRGITHSLLFAIGLGILAAVAGRGRVLAPGAFGLIAGLALASHGLLDTMSQLGNGPMLFWPFTTESFEFAWRPIPGVLNAAHYLTSEAIPTFITETLLFFPLIAFALVTLFPRRVEKTAAEESVG